MCEFVGNIADDPMTKNIQNSTGCNNTILCESLSGPSISVIYVDNMCRPLQRSMKEASDRVVARKARRWWLMTPRKAASRYEW